MSIGKKFSRGAELLQRAISSRAIGINEAGRLCGFEQGVMSRYVSGERCPASPQRFVIEDEFGIDPRSFDEPATESGPLPQSDDEPTSKAG